MDSVALIMAALQAVVSGAGGAAGKELWQAVKGRLASRQEATLALSQYERKPDVWEAPVRDAVDTLGVATDDEIIELARTVLSQGGVRQNAQGEVIAQIGGDAGTIVQVGRIDSLSVVAPDAGVDTTYLGLEVPKGRDSRYQELASYMESAIGGELGIGVGIDFGNAAEVFESEEKDHLLNITREFLGIHGGKERQDEGFAEISMSEAGPDGRKAMVQCFREGQASVWVFRPDQLVQWDWVLVESYRVVRCLCSKGIRRIYGSAAQGKLTLGVRWPENGIAPGGEHLGTIPATPPSEPPGSRSAARSSPLEFGADPWPLVQEFTVLALSRAGYKYHEKRIREMDWRTVFEIWFRDPDPLRYVVARYTL